MFKNIHNTKTRNKRYLKNINKLVGGEPTMKDDKGDYFGEIKNGMRNGNGKNVYKTV